MGFCGLAVRKFATCYTRSKARDHVFSAAEWDRRARKQVTKDGFLDDVAEGGDAASEARREHRQCGEGFEPSRGESRAPA